MTLSDTTVTRLIEIASRSQSQTTDYQSMFNIIAMVCILPVCWILIRYFLKKHEESMKAISDGMNNLAKVVERTSDDIKTQVLKTALQEKDITDLKEAKYEHLKLITELQKQKNEIEKSIAEIKHKHESSNEITLRNHEAIEDMQTQLDKLDDRLEIEIKAHDSCKNFDPLRHK